MDIMKLFKNLLKLEEDTDMILQGKCPWCGAEMPEPKEDEYEGPLCYLCPECREKYQ